MKKYVLPAVAVLVLGYIFLNLAFLLDFFYQTIIRALLQPIYQWDKDSFSLFPAVLHISYLLLLGILSWFLLRLRMHRILKASYLTVPLAAGYVTIGMFTYANQVVSFLCGAVFGGITLYAILKTKLHWLYQFAWGAITVTMILGAIFGMEI